MRDVLMTRWTEIGDKIVSLADEFPAKSYDFSPAAGVRTFAEQLRHIAFWNMYLLQTLRGERANGDANELPATKYPSKSKIVDVLRESVADVKDQIAGGAAALEAPHAESVVSFIEHSGEHYGQLVVYYRLNDLVPPASR